MVSGFSKYFQIARCFRDEDTRKDRQPEFTQIDIETSFMSAEQVMEVTETMTRQLFQQLLDIDLGKFPTMTWHEAMRRFGSDKPDTRFGMEHVDLTQTLNDVSNVGVPFFEKTLAALEPAEPVAQRGHLLEGHETA